MATHETPALPVLSAEHRRIAAERFDRANQVVASGEFDYGIQLLLTCCKLDPTNMLFRQTLRRTQKAKRSQIASTTRSTSIARSSSMTGQSSSQSA